LQKKESEKFMKNNTMAARVSSLKKISKMANLGKIKSSIKNLLVSRSSKQRFEAAMLEQFGITHKQMYVIWQKDRRVAVIANHPWKKETMGGRIVVEAQLRWV
jgi:hypothetical protein